MVRFSDTARDWHGDLASAPRREDLFRSDDDAESRARARSAVDPATVLLLLLSGDVHQTNVPRHLYFARPRGNSAACLELWRF